MILNSWIRFLILTCPPNIGPGLMLEKDVVGLDESSPYRRNQIPAQDGSSPYRFLYSHEWEIHLKLPAVSVEISIG